MPKLLWGFAFGPKATAFLDALPPGKIRRQLVKKARTLQGKPWPQGCKKLHGVQSLGEDVWRIRSGDYRILYVVRSNEVLILDIDDRKDVYR